MATNNPPRFTESKTVRVTGDVRSRQTVGYVLACSQVRRLQTIAKELLAAPAVDGAEQHAGLSRRILAVLDNAFMGPITAVQMHRITVDAPPSPAPAPAPALSEAEKASLSELRETVTKADIGSSRHMIIQSWSAPTREALEAEAAYQMQQYHPAGYGTSVRDYKQDSYGWTCRFSRGTSCD
jgi:hypothetical protein